jgi:hypothetical protein
MLKISTFTADRTPEEAFAAINNVRGFVVKEIRALKVAPTKLDGPRSSMVLSPPRSWQ